MKPVMQTKFGHAREDCGDCFSACVASILEMPLGSVPLFCAMKGDWFAAFQEWLRQFGLTALCVEYSGVSVPPPGLLVIAGGKSPRGDWRHSVLIQDGLLIWDPHPMHAGLDGAADCYDIIAPLDVSDFTKGRKGNDYHGR